jgi:hypothetical protein
MATSVEDLNRHEQESPDGGVDGGLLQAELMLPGVIGELTRRRGFRPLAHELSRSESRELT